MGTKPASGELAKALTPLLQHIPGAHVIQDDVIIAEKNDGTRHATPISKLSKA